MNLQISGSHLSLSDALKNFAEARLAQCLAPLVESDATEVQVMLSAEQGADAKEAMHFRVNVHIPRDGQITVARNSDNIYTAIDLVHDALVQRTKSLLERHHDLHRIRKGVERNRVHEARKNMTTFEDRDESIDAKTAGEVEAFENSREGSQQLL